jgi:hypothetical protein
MMCFIVFYLVKFVGYYTELRVQSTVCQAVGHAPLFAFQLTAGSEFLGGKTPINNDCNTKVCMTVKTLVLGKLKFSSYCG